MRPTLPTALLIALCTGAIPAQVSAPQPAPVTRMPPDYRGPQVQIQGIFVTPIPGAAFSAKVDIVSTQLLPNGTSVTRTTVNHIARDGSGRIYNERRRLVPATFQGDPPLTSAHIFDPFSHVSVYLDPYTRLARQSTLANPPNPTANANAPRPTPNTTEEKLGTQELNGVAMNGIRKTRTIPAALSETGKDILISDDYWFSPELSLYLLIKHTDPRTGTQLIAITDIDRHEPDPTRFIIPAGYKVVDETPVPRDTAAFR